MKHIHVVLFVMKDDLGNGGRVEYKLLGIEKRGGQRSEKRWGGGEGGDERGFGVEDR